MTEYIAFENYSGKTKKTRESNAVFRKIGNNKSYDNENFEECFINLS